jgi:2-oxoisovalerate dehydrogenase E1 component alpha subunit
MQALRNEPAASFVDVPPTSSDAATYRRYIPEPTGVREALAEARPPGHERLLELYRHMVVARTVDQEAIFLQRQGHLGVYASSLGQEAAQVGSAAALRTTDWIFPSYREMGAAVVRGLPPEAILHAWRGTWFAAHDIHEHRFGLLTIPLATQALHAVGFALASAQEGRDDVVMCYLGDGATSEGDAHEAFNFASVFDLPVVFVIQNNQYAISVPLSRQTRAHSLAHKGFAYGMAGFSCDGNDATAVHGATTEAVARARDGRGPSIVEAITYRMEAHTTSDDPRRYRPDEEVAHWRERDPVAHIERHLEREGLLGPDLRDQVARESQDEASRVRRAIEESVEPEPEHLFDHVLVRRSPKLDRQREEVRRAFDS